MGKLIGNTGNPVNLTVALKGSFSARRGEFVRIPHREREKDSQTDCLGRIVSLSRTNVLYSQSLGEGVEEVNVLPGSLVSGETLYASVEMIGFKDPATNEIRMPRRPLDPGSPVYGVSYDFLRRFYEFSEETSIHIGNLVGYETGEEAVPIYLDVNTLATEHLAVLAMTGSGKSYTVGRIIERLVGQMNGTVVVFDPHGEYGRAFEGGRIRTNEAIDEIEDETDRAALRRIVENLGRLQEQGGGITIYTPQESGFDGKYASANRRLALQFDNLELDALGGILPGITEPQMRVLDVAIRKWKRDEPDPPRDVQTLIDLLSRRLEEVREDPDLDLTQEEQKALGARSAAIAGMRLRALLNEAKAFYTAACDQPTDIRALIGRRGQGIGRLVIVDLQGLSDDARQIIVALLSSEILNAAASNTDPIRPCFLVYEEGHNFAPAGGPSISRAIIKKIAGEGRKFGVGFAVISQRPLQAGFRRHQPVQHPGDHANQEPGRPALHRQVHRAAQQGRRGRASGPVHGRGPHLGPFHPGTASGEGRLQGVEARRGVPAHPGRMEPREPAVKVRVRHIAENLKEEFETLSFGRAEFPMLTRWGVADYGQTIHSLGCNYLAAFGRSLDCLACTEYPIRLPKNPENMNVRVDIAWWDRATEHPLLIGEFERCEPGRAAPGLIEKARNLLCAHRTLPPGPRVLLLTGWKRSGVTTGDLSHLRNCIVEGFRAPGGRVLRGLWPDSRFILAVADMAVDSEKNFKLAKVRML